MDKDPDLQKSSDLEPINRSWVPWVLAGLGGFIGIVLVVVAGLLAFKLFGWITGDDDAKAASAGAWASAVGATALAVASVWLAVQANQQARAAEQQAQTEADKVEQRHKDELKAAEKRLTDELDAQRKQQQLLAITPMWKELVAMSEEYRIAVEGAQTFAILRERKLMARLAVTSDDVAPIMAITDRWSSATSQFDLSCSSALMMVTDPATAPKIAKFYVEFRLLQKEVIEHLQICLVTDPLDLDRKGLDVRMKTLRLMRREIIRSARENIVGAEWHDLSVNGIDPFEVGDLVAAPTAKASAHSIGVPTTL